MVDEHHRYIPAEPLRRYVAAYTGYRQRGLPPARHRGLPSPYLTLIFTLDEPLTIEVHPDPGQPPGEFGTLLGGLHSVPALITHAGAQSGIQVALRPLGARALLGLPAGELAELDLPAEAVLGGVCAELRDRVRAAAGWPERFAVLDEILLRAAGLRGAGLGWVGPGPGIAPEVSWAWRQLLREGGALRVSELAAGTGWSGRHLTSRFRAEIGLTPKAAARVIRFDRARKRLVRKLTAGGDYLLADLAADCGYFDQAHLAREFRALAGCPPSQWLAEEFRNVQAGNWLRWTKARRYRTARAKEARHASNTGTSGLAHAAGARRPGADQVPGRRVRLRGDGRLRGRRPGGPRPAVLARRRRRHARLGPRWRRGRARPVRVPRRPGRAPSAPTWSPTTWTRCTSGPGRPARTIITEPHDTDYGSHDFAAADPEGNRWSFGTYRGEPRKGGVTREPT